MTKRVFECENANGDKLYVVAETWTQVIKKLKKHDKSSSVAKITCLNGNVVE